MLLLNHWPSAPPLHPDINPRYFGRAVAGFTEGSGTLGWGFGGESWINAAEPESHNGGPYSVWASGHPENFQPAQDRVIGSDCLAKIGWWDDHIILNPVFRIMRKPGGTQSPVGTSRLVVYDKQGFKIGYTPLVIGNGNGGRIALVTDGQELAYTKLI